MIPPNHQSAPDAVLATDACLTGLGGVCGEQCFHYVLQPHQFRRIAELEMLALTTAVRLWQNRLLGQRIIVLCDNTESVCAVNSGACRSPFMQMCLREIAHISAVNQCEIRAQHIAGVENRLPDLLSRWHLTPNPDVLFAQLTGNAPMNHWVLSDQQVEIVDRW